VSGFVVIVFLSRREPVIARNGEAASMRNQRRIEKTSLTVPYGFVRRVTSAGSTPCSLGVARSLV
jgi:hypothetical protein